MVRTLADLNRLEKLEVLEELLAVNARRSVIEEFFPEVKGDRMLRDRMNESRRRILANEGGPRGKSLSATSPKFLASTSDRYQASILIALANRIVLPPKHTVEFAEHLATVYKGLGSRVMDVSPSAKLSFNDFAIAMDGISVGHLKMDRCGECNSMFVKKRDAVGRSKACPFCKLMSLGSRGKVETARWIIEMGDTAMQKVQS